MKQELKEIETEKVYANFYQPREKFDKEQIQELAESILSNGLINPITVREWKNGKYMIVAGERRWRAHKLAGLKTIQAFVKSYENDGQWMVESLIENVHRENLDPFERVKYMKKIMQIAKLTTYEELSKLTGISINSIKQDIPYGSADKSLKNKVSLGTLSARQVREIASVKDKKEQQKVSKIAENLSVPNTEKLISLVKRAPEDVKEALLNDKINVEQAERISKLQTEKEREQAIKNHSAIQNIEKNIEKNISNQTQAQAKRSFEKRLLETRNWLNSFRGSVTDSRSQLEKTFKTLMIATRFLPVMDDKQKERLSYDLDRFLETLEKSKQIAEKIQGYIE